MTHGSASTFEIWGWYRRYWVLSLSLSLPLSSYYVNVNYNIDLVKYNFLSFPDTKRPKNILKMLKEYDEMFLTSLLVVF